MIPEAAAFRQPAGRGYVPDAGGEEPGPRSREPASWPPYTRSLLTPLRFSRGGCPASGDWGSGKWMVDDGISKRRVCETGNALLTTKSTFPIFPSLFGGAGAAQSAPAQSRGKQRQPGGVQCLLLSKPADMF